jgi:hypothetical protein
MPDPICSWCGKPDSKCRCDPNSPPVRVPEVPKQKARLALTTWMLGVFGQLLVWVGGLTVAAPFVGGIIGSLSERGRESFAAAALMSPWTTAVGAFMIWSGGVLYLLVQLIKVGIWQREE